MILLLKLMIEVLKGNYIVIILLLYYLLHSQDAGKFKNTLLLDHAEIPMIPDLNQRELMMAQNYLIKLKNKNFNEEVLLDRQEKSAYEKIFEVVSEKMTPTFLIESFISEKSYDFENIMANKKLFIDLKAELKDTSNDKILQSTINKEKSKTVDMINDIISKYKLDNLKPVDYEHEYIGKRNYKNLEPRMNISQSKNVNEEKISFKSYNIEKNLK
jgi:hypothetical protein